MNKEQNFSNYEIFLTENKKRVNEQFSFILKACIVAGPMIALFVRFNIFSGVTYVTAITVSLFMFALAVIHKLLLKRHADSMMTSMVALFAIDVLLIVMDAAHLTIFITWFLIPLLCLQFCDYGLYALSVAVNYTFMVYATWHMAPYFAERRVDFDTPMAYFLSRLGGLTIEMIIMIIAGYSLCKITRSYYKALIEQSNKLDEEQKEMRVVMEQLSSVMDIYMYACEINLFDNSFYELQADRDKTKEFFGERKTDASTHMRDDIVEYVAEEYKLDILVFVNLNTINERMGDEPTIAMEFKGSDDRWRRAKLIVSARYDDGKIRRVIFMVEDIDAEKKSRDALIDMSERAIAANEAKSAFLSNMSHEIRTPINAILGMNEMIIRENADKEIAAYAQNIKSAGASLLGIVNDILDFSKIEAGKMEIIPVDYDMSEVLNDLVTLVHLRAEEKGLSISLDFDPQMPKILHGDEVRLKQIITNVLTNAVKYTEEGSILFGMGFEKIPGDYENIKLIVSVKDTGIGIKTEDMKRLFTEFERIEEKRNRNIEGTGLGMNITKRLLEMMGSSLQVESVYGEGSRFFFSIQQRVVEWEPLGDYEAAYKDLLKEKVRYHEKFTAPKAIVLAVDDNDMNLTVFESLLKKTLIQIDTAGSGQEGLLKSKEKKYDIIFLDHMMPEKDGIETLKEIKADPDNPNAGTPTVCFTANAIAGARDLYIEAGFDDYLTKPIDSARLEEMIVTYLPEDKVEIAEPEGSLDEAQEDVSEAPKFAALKGQELINVETGIQNSGSKDAYLPILKIFYNSLEDKLSEIEGYYQSDNLYDYTIKVHALKSSARLIGATDLGDEAQKLEDAGKAKDTEYIFENHELFMENCRRHKEIIRPVFESEEKDEKKPLADEDVLSDLYEGFRQAAAEMDCDWIEEIVEETRKYEFDGSDKELMDKLTEAADRFDYEAVTSLLERKG